MNDLTKSTDSFNSATGYPSHEATPSSQSEGLTPALVAGACTPGQNLISQQKLQPDPEIQSQLSLAASETSQNIDWQQLAHKLRDHNRKLLKKVFSLEQNLIDATNQVRQHQEIARQEELTITEQTEKLNHSQEEVANLLQQLEQEQQETRSQQVLIENLSLQLKASQEQTAKLERECAVIQENYNQKNYEVLSLTEQKEELESRLYRQQQHTLYYKVALEKYTKREKSSEKLPGVKLPAQIEEVRVSGVVSRLGLSDAVAAGSTLAKRSSFDHQAIQPWSHNYEELTQSQQTPIQSGVLGKQEDQKVTPSCKDRIPLPITHDLPNAAPLPVDKIVSDSSVAETLEKPKTSDWPAPEIANISQKKSPKSIAAIKLPKFQQSSNQQKEAY
ncbi:MAG TPA: hypothetical protein ACFCUY_17155 [Xenococcaceae cyanobacterium]